MPYARSQLHTLHIGIYNLHTFPAYHTRCPTATSGDASPTPIHPQAQTRTQHARHIRTPTTRSMVTASARTLYRALLRELPALSLAGGSSGSSARASRVRTMTPAHAFVRQAFQQHSGSGSGAPGKALQIGRYLRAQRTYAALLERYNPALAPSRAPSAASSAWRGAA